MLSFHTDSIPEDLCYKLLTSLVAPRPIAWVSSISPEGVRNLAPFSFFNVVCDSPPLVFLSISKRDNGRRKDTAENIIRVGEFVINFVSEELIKEVELTSGDFPPEVDEFDIAGLTPMNSELVKVPSVKEARAWMECTLFRHEELFGYDLILGRVVNIRLRDQDLKPIGRLSGRFCKVFEINQGS
jgi:flavin reductase (DIM6/NTAB) family NADH-FMN oxidoreductase RutF